MAIHHVDGHFIVEGEELEQVDYSTAVDEQNGFDLKLEGMALCTCV